MILKNKKIWRRFFLLLSGGWLAFPGAISSQSLLTPSDITIQNFKAGGEGYSVRGELAIINGNMVRINQLNAVVDGDDGQIEFYSSACDFDQINRLAVSSESVKVKGQNLDIAGVGFDLNLATQRIIIRSQVKVRIYHRDTMLPLTERQ